MNQSEFETNTYVAGVKRGKKRAGKSRLVLVCFSLVEKVARVLLTNHRDDSEYMKIHIFELRKK